MIKKVDHIGLAVSNLDEFVNMCATLFGLEAKIIEDYPGIKAAFLPIGDVTLEPIQPIDKNHRVAQVLEKHGNSIYHICFEVDDIDHELQVLAAKGVELLDKKGRLGLTGKIGYLHPSATGGIFIELVQKTTDPIVT